MYSSSIQAARLCLPSYLGDPRYEINRKDRQGDQENLNTGDVCVQHVAIRYTRPREDFVNGTSNTAVWARRYF